MPSYVLFGRGRVLLPGQRLGIRVHDVHLASLLSDTDEFCAAFAPGGEFGSIGVRARTVARSRAPHDRLDVEVVGGARLHLGSIDGDLVEARELAEPPGEGDVALLRDELQRGVQRLAAAAAEAGTPASISSVLHRDPTLASYQAATVLPLSHPERQELLEIETTTERLEQELRIVAGETGVLRHLLGLGRMGS